MTLRLAWISQCRDCSKSDPPGTRGKARRLCFLKKARSDDSARARCSHPKPFSRPSKLPPNKESDRRVSSWWYSSLLLLLLASIGAPHRPLVKLDSACKPSDGLEASINRCLRDSVGRAHTDLLIIRHLLFFRPARKILRASWHDSDQ